MKNQSKILLFILVVVVIAAVVFFNSNADLFKGQANKNLKSDYNAVSEDDDDDDDDDGYGEVSIEENITREDLKKLIILNKYYYNQYMKYSDVAKDLEKSEFKKNK